MPRRKQKKNKLFFKVSQLAPLVAVACLALGLSLPITVSAQPIQSYLGSAAGGAGGGCDSSQNPSSGCKQANPREFPVDPVTCNQGGCDLINKYINPGIMLLSAAFGTIAAISLISAGILYSSSEGDPQKASRAKSRITNTIIAIVAFLFLYAFLQFLVPGGIFNRSG